MVGTTHSCIEEVNNYVESGTTRNWVYTRNWVGLHSQGRIKIARYRLRQKWKFLYHIKYFAANHRGSFFL